MQQINEILLNGAVSILVILLGIAVKAVKDYLVQKGGEKTIKIVEILAKNAVNAVEQVASETGYKGEEKLEQARTKFPAPPEVNRFLYLNLQLSRLMMRGKGFRPLAR